MEITRRAAVWLAPVIALAVAAPAASASTPVEHPMVCGGTPGNNGIYRVYSNRIEIMLDHPQDLIEVTVQYGDAAHHIIYKNTDPGDQLLWVIPLAAPITWAQLHGFNAHLGQECR